MSILKKPEKNLFSFISTLIRPNTSRAVSATTVARNVVALHKKPALQICTYCHRNGNCLCKDSGNGILVIGVASDMTPGVWIKIASTYFNVGECISTIEMQNCNFLRFLHFTMPEQRIAQIRNAVLFIIPKDFDRAG